MTFTITKWVATYFRLTIHSALLQIKKARYDKYFQF